MLNPFKRTFIFTLFVVKQKLLVNLFAQEEIYHLQMIAYLKFYHKELIVRQFSNIHSLQLHFQYILKYFNLFASHIFCLNETKIQNIQIHQEIYNVISNKFNILSCYNGYATTMLYRTIMFSSHTFSLTNLGLLVFFGIKGHR
jgi:hypothetical protein